MAPGGKQKVALGSQLTRSTYFPQKPLDFIQIPPTRLVPTVQPIGQLLRVAAHLDAKFFERQSVDLLVPGQFFQDIVGTRDRIIAKKGDDLGDVPEIDGPSMLPVPNGGSGYAELGCNIFLA
jgi:hypothetical protein